jgi:hypothetical protein
MPDTKTNVSISLGLRLFFAIHTATTTKGLSNYNFQ